jgi:hypothetical protein
VSTVDLIKAPKKIFRCTVYVVSPRVIREVTAQRRPGELLFKQVDFVQEEDDTGPHEPPGVHYRIEEYETFHHSILNMSAVRLV